MQRELRKSSTRCLRLSARVPILLRFQVRSLLPTVPPEAKFAFCELRRDPSEKSFA